MMEVIDLLNYLADKYQFDEADVDRIREVVYSIQENLDADKKAEGFVDPTQMELALEEEEVDDGED